MSQVNQEGSKTPDLRVPLVGCRFYPPATSALQHTAAGSPIMILYEPGNPYDPDAIQVWLSTRLISPDGAEDCEAQGFDLAQAQEQDECIQLGHIASSTGAICKKLGCPGNREVKQWFMENPEETGTLTFGPDDRPEILFTIRGGEAPTIRGA